MSPFMFYTESHQQLTLIPNNPDIFFSITSASLSPFFFIDVNFSIINKSSDTVRIFPDITMMSRTNVSEIIVILTSPIDTISLLPQNKVDFLVQGFFRDDALVFAPKDLLKDYVLEIYLNQIKIKNVINESDTIKLQLILPRRLSSQLHDTAKIANPYFYAKLNEIRNSGMICPNNSISDNVVDNVYKFRE